MSLRNLVEDQCGAANSLVQLSSHFVQDRGLTDQGLLHPFQHENFPEQNEPLQQIQPPVESPQYDPHSFRMDSLLSEMRNLEMDTLAKDVLPNEANSTINTSVINENVSDWANQYLKSGSSFAPIEENPYQSNIWSTDQVNEVKQLGQNTKPFNANEFDFNANWGHDYLKEPPMLLGVPDILSTLCSPEISELQYVAGQVANSMNEPQFTDSKFLKFMNQVSDGQVQYSDNEFIGADNQEESFNKWADKEISPIVKSATVEVDSSEKLFSQWGTLPTLVGSDQNENIYVESEKSDENTVKEDLYSKELWSKLTERWEQLNLANQDPWDSEFKQFVASVQNYKFAEENPMADKTNALEEGKKRLAEDDLPSAVLCFEAAVQQNSESVEGWQLLGKTQAENEQDQQAIAALKKCIQLDASNLDALKELAVCYTNENYQYQACYALKEWLARNPKYQDIVEECSLEKESEKGADVTSLLTSKFFNDVLNLYLKAVQRFSNTDEADADVQNGLGVLLTLNSDYDKAIDCFETAVKLRPTDSRLWNRLGATLANGQKPEQALEAYRKTLKLSPGFIRARYNLGITCVHLKMYKQAVEHLLVALNQQVSGHGIHGEKSHAMSESIWTTLKLALALSERKDLLPLADARNLDALNKEFHVLNVMAGEDDDDDV